MLSIILGFFLITSAFTEVIKAPQALMDFQQNPSEIEWKKIDTVHFEIIFPKEVEVQAQRVTHLLEAAYPLVTRSLEVAPPKLSLILQNQSTISNGFVTLAPRRSEWYLTPAIDPDLTNTEWLKTLSIHEFRHVVQFQKTRQGFNRFYEIILGEIGQALGLGLSLPPWFLEGDAVGIETALSVGGRGRLPLFERDLRTLLLSGKDFDYDKAHLGSYKDYIPNHYVYGYFYTTFMRNKQGDLFLSHLANMSTQKSYNPLTFYNAYANATGMAFEDFYRKTLKEMIKNWKEKEQKLVLTPFEVKNIYDKKDWINYLYPQAVGKNKFLALKKGLSFIEQFVIFDVQNEKTIFYPGPLHNEYPYKVRNNRLAFVEYEVDPRWGVRDFSRVKVYDLVKNAFVADLRRTKARLAVLDESGEKILYVNWDELQGQEIVIRDLSGKVLFQHKYPVDKVITSLDWHSSKEIVMVVKDYQDQKKIIKISLTNRQEAVLLAPSTLNLGFITSQLGKVLIESPTSGIDNIFEVTQFGLKQITSSRFGAYAPSLFNDELVYNDYSVSGMNVAVKKMAWDEKQESTDSFVPYFEKLALFEASDKSRDMNQDFFNQDKYPVTPYSQVKNAINLHSWLILAPPLSADVMLVGISRDVLNKFSLMAGASYDINEQETEGFVSAAWSHLYPVFDLRAGYGGRSQNKKSGSKEIQDHWEEGTFEAGMQIPWKRISGRFLHDFSIRGFGKVIKVTNKNSDDVSEIRNGALFSSGAQMQYSFVSRQSRRDLNPSLGASLLGHVEAGKDFTGNSDRGSIETLDGRIYLPGFFRHHSFFHQLAFEKQRDKSYQYSSLLTKPRGTSNIFLEEMTKYSGNYLFPLAYPDWHASSYIYFKRLSLNLFFDEVNGYDRGFNYSSASTGWEALLDTHFFRIFIPITLGLRGSYVLYGNAKKQNYEIFVTTLGGYF